MENLAEKLPDEIINFPAVAMTITVTDQPSFGRAGEVIKALKDFKKQTTEWFSPLKTKAHATWKETVAKENEALAPLDKAETYLRGQMNGYLAAQERIRLEEERKARIVAEEAAKKERERLEAQALKAMEAGKDAKAESLMEKAENVYVAPIAAVTTVAPVRTETAHVGYVEQLTVEVTDLKAFVSALIQNGSALTMIKIEPGKLQAWAKANALEKFPGLHIEKTKVARVR
jgi:hypothetical protein